MKNNHDNIFNTLRTIRLAETKKKDMRTHLVKHVTSSNAVKESFAKYPLHRRVVHVATLAVIFVLGSAGMTVASENTVPGDLLYPVKIGVAEEVRAFLTPTVEGKVRLNEERLNKRIEEAQKLASLGRLDEEKKEFLSRKMESHIEESTVLTLHERREIAVTLLEMEGKLAAYEEVLNALSEKKTEQKDNEEKEKEQIKGSEAGSNDQEEVETETVLVEEELPVEEGAEAEENSGASTEEVVTEEEKENESLAEEEISAQEITEEITTVLNEEIVVKDRVQRESLSEKVQREIVRKQKAPLENTMPSFDLLLESAQNGVVKVEKKLEEGEVRESAIPTIEKKVTELRLRIEKVVEERQEGTEEGLLVFDLEDIIRLSQEINALLLIQNRIDLPELSQSTPEDEELTPVVNILDTIS